MKISVHSWLHENHLRLETKEHFPWEWCGFKTSEQAVNVTTYSLRRNISQLSELMVYIQPLMSFKGAEASYEPQLLSIQVK